MTDQIIDQVPFYPEQCIICKNYLISTHNCQGFMDESQSNTIPAVFNGVSTEACPRLDQIQPPEKTVPDAEVENITENPAAQGVAMIYCPKCKTENPTNFERCGSCDAKLLPAESVGQRLAYLFGGLISAAILASMFYQFYVFKPGSAPDFVLCNQGALGLGAIAVLVTGFTQALRKTPDYVRYENRAKRHLNLNLRQSLSDINQAMELAPKKEQGRLLKQRAEIYDKLGWKDDAARDHLVLSTSPNAYKSEGDWVSAITGADADVYAHSRLSAQIGALLKSGNARAVGYCSKCKRVVELSESQNCPDHPKTKGREIQYVIPADVLAGQLAVLQSLETSHSHLKIQIAELLEAGKAKAVGYCPRCKAAVELDATRHCPIHQRTKMQSIQFVLPKNVEAGKRAVLLARREQQPITRRRILLALGITLLGIAILWMNYSAQLSGYIEELLK